MDNKNNGYLTKQYPFPTKRYCQTMDLKNDPELIKEYRKCHSAEEHWPVIRKGIREVGILEMDIYLVANHLCMIVETPLDFEWESAMEKLSTLPQQAEWEEFVSRFQCAEHDMTSSEKWQLLDRIFYLYQ